MGNSKKIVVDKPLFESVAVNYGKDKQVSFMNLKQPRIRARTEEAKYVLTGLERLIEATALGTTSIYAIYAAQHNHLPHWGAVGLTISGVIITLLAFSELIKVLARRA